MLVLLFTDSTGISHDTDTIADTAGDTDVDTDVDTGILMRMSLMQDSLPRCDKQSRPINCDKQPSKANESSTAKPHNLKQHHGLSTMIHQPLNCTYTRGHRGIICHTLRADISDLIFQDIAPTHCQITLDTTNLIARIKYIKNVAELPRKNMMLKIPHPSGSARDN